MNPFHDGERAVQARAGETHTALLNGRMISESIVVQALPFIRKQPWAVLGGLDGDGRLWCSALVGEAGFAEPSADGGEVRFDLRRARARAVNPLLGTVAPGQALGGLFIELATRRRLRVNGHVTDLSDDTLRLAVEESFPNCPKFITLRAFEGAGGRVVPAPRRGAALGEAERAWVQSADTLFLATHHPGRGADASHRGGPPGFVEVVDSRTLRLPDYAGNGLFQTFGNLECDPRLGMLVPDFATGALLHLTGTAHVVWEAPDPGARTGGTGRFLEMDVERWVLTP
ncbi:MAG TPA: pyridoxamine 5'-phosphate oxidase family protein [Holophagaceae bacterium]|nr:pyridoxamine 5'-phosphate oxidase family protein [Holophagaceae bacterium]